jgi:hypothetical protein
MKMIFGHSNPPSNHKIVCHRHVVCASLSPMNVSLRPATLSALQAFRQRREKLLQYRAWLAVFVVALLALLVIALLDRARLMPESIRSWFTLSVYVGAVIFAWRVAWRFIAEASNLSGAALLLEAAAPQLRERLVAAVELSEGHGNESAEFRAQLQDDVAMQLQKVSLDEALPLRSLKPWVMGATGSFVGVSLLCFISTLHLPGFLARAAIPFSNFARPSSVQIRVVTPDPADMLVPIASDLEVFAEIIGPAPDLVQIETQSGDAKSRLQNMTRGSGTMYQGLVSIGQSDVRYRILASDAVSSWHTLSARPRPRVIEFAKTIVPPAYTGLPDIKLTEEHGDVEAFEGSTLKLELKANQPISKAELLINPDHADHRPAIAVQNITDGVVKTEFIVNTETESWQMVLSAEETGFTNDESSPWSITTIPDLPPFVQIFEPAEQLEMMPDESVRLSGAASDDVGLASVKLAHQINAGAWSEKELSGKTGKESQVQTLMPLAALQLKVGDSIVLKLIATDLKGQVTESPPVRVVILEQIVSPQQRQWAAQTRRFALQAETLAEDTRELKKAVEQLRKTEKQADRNPEAARDAQDALARAQTELEKVTSKSDDLWKELQESARLAPTHLDATEVQLLGERLTHMRADALKEMQKAISANIDQPDGIKRDASEAQADIDSIASAARAFAAEDNARLVSQQAQQLARQEALLTEQSLPANRDASQRPKWQEQQRGALAASEPLRDQMEGLKTLVDGGQQNQLKEFQKQLAEAGADLEASLDKADQAKSPEHLYGAADNLRQRLSRTADAARGMAEQAANRAMQLREQIARQENPAIVALNEARDALAQAATEAKKPQQKPREDRNGDTAQEKAAKELATAARQLEEQATLREQNALTNDESALDTNRASRAADKLAREAEQPAAASQPEALAQTQQKAEQLRDAVRALEADALVQTAVKASEEAAFNSDKPADSPAAQDARAAAEALKQLPEALRKMKQPDPQSAQNAQMLAQQAQQAADQSRNAAEQLQNLAKQAAIQPPSQPLNTQPARQAAEQARQQASEVAQQLAAQTEAARESLAQLTPKVSDMMKAVAQELKETQKGTQAAAAEAEAQKPVAEVAEKAVGLEGEAEENTEKMASLQAALRQEANAADLQNQTQRQMSRTADAALAQMQQSQPQVAQNLKQAAQAQQSQPQAQALKQAAQAQQQAAQALDQLAQNMAKAESGQELTAQELADAAQMEQDLGVKEPLDEAYARAQALAQMAQDAQQDPGKVLAELEKELPKNAAMQKALAELGKQTAQASEQAVASEAQQPVNMGLATEQAANDLNRVARHQQRLGQEEAAQQTAQAAQQLQAQAAAARSTPSAPGQPAPATPKPVGAESLAPAAQAAKAAEATAAATPPVMTAHPLETVQAAYLAQALDQLDAQLHPMQAQNGQQQQQSQQGQQGQQPGQQQSAQQSLSQAQQSQQQQMADQRNQGQTPGSQQPGQPQMAQGQQPGQQQSQSQATTQTEGGDLQAMLKDGALGTEMILVKGDWGHLPSKMAEDLTEATRSEAAPEYRAAIESYYKAIANKARK